MSGAPTPRPTYCQPDDRMCWLRARRRTLRLAESTSRRPSGLRGAFPASFRSPRPDVSDGRSDGRTRGADHLASSPSLSSTALPLPPPDGGSASAERARLDVRRRSAGPAGSGQGVLYISIWRYSLHCAYTGVGQRVARPAAAAHCSATY